ncbi:PaaI family thioesterase [Geodermatophilus sp. SYSU D00703]
MHRADTPAPDGPAPAGEGERRRIAAELAAGDHAVRALSVEVTAVGEGSAVVELALGRDHTNGLGLAHGGVVFLVADTAMAYASIRPGSGAAVTTGADVVFSKPATLGSRLVAESRCVHRQGRREVHDVRVTDDDGVVALVRGQMVQREAAAGPAGGPDPG